MLVEDLWERVHARLVLVHELLMLLQSLLLLEVVVFESTVEGVQLAAESEPHHHYGQPQEKAQDGEQTLHRGSLR
jgi:hypothetical protein